MPQGDQSKDQQCPRPADNRDFGDKVADAVVGFGDAFLIPILVRDLFDISGNIDYDSTAYEGGKIAGVVWGSVPFAAEGAAAYSAGQAARGTPALINANRYFRIGPGRIGRDMVPRVSIGGPGGPHASLASRLPRIPPLGVLASASNCQ